MSSQNAVKYRPRHKRLKDLRDEDTRHGFEHRIHVRRSRTHPSDAVFCTVWAIDQALGSDRPNNSNQDPAPTKDKKRVRVPQPLSIDVVAASPKGSRSRSAPTDMNDHISLYSMSSPETMGGKSGPNTSNHHPSPTERDGNLFSCPTSLTTKICTQNASESITPYTGNGQAHEIASYAPHDEFQGTTYNFRRGIISPQCPIASGGLPYPPPTSHDFYRDRAISIQRSSSVGPSHIGLRGLETPPKNHARSIPMFPPDDGFAYPSSSQIHNPMHGAPPSHLIASGGLPLPVPGSLDQLTAQQLAYNDYPQHGGQGYLTNLRPTIPSIPSPHGSTWELGADTRDWNQYSMPSSTIPMFPASSYQFGSEGRPTVPRNCVQGGIPDVNYQQNYLRMPIADDYNSHGQDIYPTTLSGTAPGPASSGSFPSASLGNSGGFHTNSESIYPQNGYFHGSSPQNDWV